MWIRAAAIKTKQVVFPWELKMHKNTGCTKKLVKIIYRVQKIDRVPL